MPRSVLVLICLLVAASPGKTWALPMAAADTSQGSRLLSYDRSGGKLGRRVTLIVSRNGRVAARPSGRRLTLTPRELRLVRADLKHAALPQLRANYTPADAVIDGYRYVIVAGGDRVRAESGAVPKRLEPLLRRCNRLLVRLGVR